MGKRMFIWDQRLKGDTPAISAGDNLYKVDASTTIDHAFGWIRDYAGQQGGLDVLYIMCHGYYAWEENQQLQMSIAVGGYGLQLCKEGLTLTTVDGAGRAIEGKIKAIVIYSCGASSTQSNNAGTKKPGDGKYFCEQLCKKSKAEVYAADREQFYSPGVRHWYDPSTWGNKGIDFGKWEGTVYKYAPPDGTRTVMEKNASPSPV